MISAVEEKPVIGLRIYFGGAAGALVNLAYYYHYGDHRCNLAQDSELKEGVYVYADIEDALKNVDKIQANSRTMCIGLVSGYLKHMPNKKGRMSLDSRSCKLLAIFAPWCTGISLPSELGVEDALAFRLPPATLGAPLRWLRQISNLRDVGITKSNIKIDSGDWLEEFPKGINGFSLSIEGRVG